VTCDQLYGRRAQVDIWRGGVWGHAVPTSPGTVWVRVCGRITPLGDSEIAAVSRLRSTTASLGTWASARTDAQVNGGDRRRITRLGDCFRVASGVSFAAYAAGVAAVSRYGWERAGGHAASHPYLVRSRSYHLIRHRSILQGVDDDRPPICPACGVTMVPTALSAAGEQDGDWVCLECEVTGEPDEG
jgi:hypothetical protein